MAVSIPQVAVALYGDPKESNITGDVRYFPWFLDSNSATKA
jgi:hypothetical protein